MKWDGKAVRETLGGLAPPWAPGAPQGAELSRTDSTQANWGMFGLLRHIENVYLIQLEGIVDESVLDSYGFRNNPRFTTPQFREYWSTRRQLFDARFVAALEAEYGLTP